MSYSIVPVSEEHFTGLYKVLDIVARERKYLAFFQAPPLEQALAFYKNIVDNDLCQFVALEGNDVVGWCDILPVAGEARSHVGILGIGLIPEVRRKGIGKKLLGAALDRAWSKGLTRIELMVRVDNLNAKTLYESYGFKVEGIKRRAHLIDGQYYDAFMMALLQS